MQWAQKTKIKRKKSMAQWRNGQMNRTKLIQRKKSKWPKNTWRNAEYLWS
jgi:hypothetical protein